MTARTVIYSRYSSDLSRDASIEDQVRFCRAHAERQGWHSDCRMAEKHYDHTRMIDAGRKYSTLIEQHFAGLTRWPDVRFGVGSCRTEKSIFEPFNDIHQGRRRSALAIRTEGAKTSGVVPRGSVSATLIAGRGAGAWDTNDRSWQEGFGRGF